MQPRIYVYKITFVGQPFWYWGVHKERKFDEYYMGSPVTNKRYWEEYTPVKEILETFECSEEGWRQAQLKEIELIKQDLENPLCLNQGCWGLFSLESLKKFWNNPENRKRHSEMRKGENNPQHGTRFIHNPLTLENTRIKKGDPLPEGWAEGAKYNPFTKEEQKKIKRARRIDKKNEFGLNPQTPEEADKVLEQYKQIQALKEKDKQDFIKRILKLYGLYESEGFEAVREAGYEKSQPNLVRLFSKYVPNFQPQMGKRRGNPKK